MSGHKTTISLEIVRETLADITMAKGRGALALIGIAIGTAAVIAMLHVGHNARAAALRDFETLGADLVAMQPQSSVGIAPSLPVEAVLALPNADVGLAESAAIVQSGGNIRYGRKDLQATIIAATDHIYTIGKAHLDRGRLTSDLDGFAPYAVIGATVAEDLRAASGKSVMPKDRIVFGNQIFTVIGVLRHTPPNFILNFDFDQSIILPFGAARRVTQDPRITSIAARLVLGVDDRKATNAIEGYFRPRLPAGATIQITTARQLIASIEQQMRIYATLILSIGAVSLVVGGVGIMNVMLMSVMERRQEIGLRLALGARCKDIRLMFLAETLILAGIGSAIGTALGYIAGWIFANSSGWQFQAAPLALPLGAGMALVVGLFFGIYPATRAARLDPVAALRSE